MSANIIDLAVQQYSGNYNLLLQREMSKFSGRVMTGYHVGSAASPVDQIGAVEMTAVTERFGNKVRVDAAVDRRWVFPSDFDLSQMIDSFDKVRLLGDPQSSYLRNAVAATNRKRDAVIAAACFADAKTGTNAGTTISFGSTTTANGGQNVAVATGAAAATGLNVAKLIEVTNAAMAREIDLDAERLVLYVTSKQHANLLNDIQVTSRDFNSQPVMEEGRVKHFMGIDFVHYESLSTGTDDAAGTSRMLPCFVKSGMYLGMWNETSPTVDQRKDIRGNPWELYHYISLGATRLEEDRVFRIWCRE